MGPRLTGVTGHVTVIPAGGLTATVMLTFPAKLNRLTSDADMATESPELKLTGLLAEIVKSPTRTVVVAWWDAVPGEPEPMMVTV